MDSQYDLFVSYAAEDSAWVEGFLLDALQAAGVRLHTEEAFALGAPRLLEFERAVQNSRRTLLVLSPAYLGAGHARFVELLAQSYGAQTESWPVIPLLLKPVPLPPRLAMLTCLDLSDPARQTAVVERLCEELRLPDRRILAPPAPPPCPYPGMRPFSEADRDGFFGRQAETQDLLQRLRLHPFCTLIGPSGSGKSSLVFAGLLPALHSSSLFGPGEWTVHSLRPGLAPLDGLHALLGPDLPPPGFSTTRRLLLVVDQFEETFTLPGEEGRLFQLALLRLIEAPGIFLVLTVRADFYADLMACPLWPPIQAHRMEITPLDSEGLRQAILAPAQAVDVYIDPALVERLLHEAAGEPGVLPFVQETLVLLWEKLERRYLPAHAYAGLAGEGSGLQAAISRRAEAAYASLPPGSQAIARRICLSLVHFGEGRANTRRQQPLDALRSVDDDPADFDACLERLAQHRLLTLTHAEGHSQPLADLGHEVLIQAWPRLARWVQDHRSAEVAGRKLQARVAGWQALDRQGGFLDAPELERAGQWLQTAHEHSLAITPALVEYIAASRSRLRSSHRRQVLAPLLAVLVVALLALGGMGLYRFQLRQQALALGPVTFIAGGEAHIGSPDGSIPEAQPEVSLPVPDFALETHEVTNAQYCRCRRAEACKSDPSYEQGAVCDEALAALPVTQVNLAQAAEYCRWVGRRLPGEVEWEWAARGPQDRLYPNGDEKPTAEQINAIDPLGKFLPAGPRPVDDPMTARFDLTPTGAAPLLGMAGNVREWTISWLLPYDHPDFNRVFWPQPAPDAGGFVVTRGGSWLSNVQAARSAVRFRVEPSVVQADIGFRCLQVLATDLTAPQAQSSP